MRKIWEFLTTDNWLSRLVVGIIISLSIALVKVYVLPMFRTPADAFIQSLEAYNRGEVSPPEIIRELENAANNIFNSDRVQSGALTGLAIVYRQTGKIDTATLYANKAIAKKKWAGAYASLALIQAKMGQFMDALETIDTAIALADDDDSEYGKSSMQYVKTIFYILYGSRDAETVHDEFQISPGRTGRKYTTSPLALKGVPLAIDRNAGDHAVITIDSGKNRTIQCSTLPELKGMTNNIILGEPLYFLGLFEKGDESHIELDNCLFIN